MLYLTSEITVKTEHALRPILITLAIAIPLTIIGIISGFSVEGAPFSEAEGGVFYAFLNALFYTIFAVIGVTLVYFAIKYGKDRVLKLFFVICFGFMGIFMIFFYLYLVAAILWLADFYIYIIVVVSIAAGFLLAYALLSEKSSDSTRNVALLLYGAFIGSFLGIVLPTWTAFLLVGILSIYDIIAVFKGPIKKIIEMTEANEDVNLPVDMTYTDRNWEIGLGDLAFYSMLACHTLLLGFEIDFLVEHGLIGAVIPFVCTVIGIVIGAMLTFRLLRKRELLPGLPLSIGFGILFYVLSLLVFWLI